MIEAPYDIVLIQYARDAGLKFVDQEFILILLEIMYNEENITKKIKFLVHYWSATMGGGSGVNYLSMPRAKS